MSEQFSEYPKAGRSKNLDVTLAIAKSAGNLALASGITLTLLAGIVLCLILAITLIIDSDNVAGGLVIAIAIAVIFNLAVFFIAPWIQDLIQGWLYKTKWVDIDELERRSPETANTLRQVCSQKKIKIPRLGTIDDQNPTAFTYGSFPDSARLVVSEGLFTYLDDDEIATVYAHELGHIVHWDFAVMTLAATLVQISYLIYVGIREMTKGSNNRNSNYFEAVALVAWFFYIAGEYLLLYLSRTREYFADHFAAEVTGNPNGLSRALVKIAYGIVEVAQQTNEPSRLLQGTRALGIADVKTSASTGTAYRVASSPERVGRVFLWDLFNPWAWWTELSSTHPLTGKRVRALSTYSEQLGLDIEFDMGRVVAEGKLLDKQKLNGGFFGDLLLYLSEFIAIAVGLVIAVIWSVKLGKSAAILAIFGVPLLLLGVAILIKRNVMFPSTAHATATDVLELMSDPYASPLRGRPVQLKGEIIGRGDAGYVFGSDLKLQDKTGMIYLKYSSRWGPLGNFLFGMKRVQALVGSQGLTTGWFHRQAMAWLDLERIEIASGTKVGSHPAFWMLIIGILSSCLGALLVFLALTT